MTVDKNILFCGNHFQILGRLFSKMKTNDCMDRT